MSAHPGDGEVHLQHAYQGTHGEFLLLRAGVGRSALSVQPTLVGNADAMAVVAPGMGTGHVQRTGAVDVAVLADVEVIADALHP